MGADDAGPPRVGDFMTRALRQRVIAHVRADLGPSTWRREAFLLGLMYAGYEWVRGMAPEQRTLAFENADRVQSIETALHIDIELWANHLLLSYHWLADFASVYYQTTHEFIAMGVLIWLWHSHRQHYAPLRTSLVILTLVSLLTYWLVPLAPPRFALDGAIDTMLAHPVLFAGMDSVTGLVNLYAAMPSVHVAWATWCAGAVASASRSRYRRWVWLYPAVTSAVVLGTGNHYVLDVVVGVLVVAASWWIAEATHPDRRRAAVGRH